MLIDIVIPVYRGPDETRRCIESVFAASDQTEAEIIVVDDCSPDPEIVAYLDALNASGRIRLLRNETNVGFVASVNRGMALHPDRDVVLLNSDTEVANDWLDRLHRAANSASDIGTVTPFSNNATICSYPYEGWTGDLPGTLGLSRLDALFARANVGRTVDLPTAVGFCMYIRRDCLKQVGPFDESGFKRGYGEENDFCLKASQLGWRHVLAADVFVYHKGAVSFGEERIPLMKSAGKLILERHPDYLTKVHAFIASDPTADFRKRIDEARSQIALTEARFVEKEQNSHRNHEPQGRSARPEQKMEEPRKNLPRKKIAILLCTFNGERFLKQQIESFSKQTYENWVVWASDDSSTDKTLAILERQRQIWGQDRLTIVSGPQKGGPSNFLSLICLESVQGDYFALSDQDDIWEPDKLARATAWLDNQPEDVPALYCGRTQLIDEKGQDLGLSPLYTRKPGFANALVQNIAGGNTMVFNKPALDLIRLGGSDVSVVVHDWWIYQVITGSGGLVHFDPNPSIRYRQHTDNLIGSNTGLKSRMNRAWHSIQGRNRAWNEIQIFALHRIKTILTARNRAIYECFSHARKSRLLPRLIGVLRSGTYHQTRLQTLWFYVIVLIKQI